MADTVDELEAVSPKIVDSVWKLESAKALTMLASRSMGPSNRKYRPSAPDDDFSGGGGRGSAPRQGGGSGADRINLSGGSGGRGVRRRR